MLTLEQLPPPPEGTILIGLASELTPPRAGWGGVYVTSPYGNWLRIEQVRAMVDAYYVAAPPDHPAALANPLSVTYHNPAVTTPLYRPLPEDVSPPPENFIILGWGDLLSNPNENAREEGYFFDGGQWLGPHQMLFPDSSFVFACPVNGHTHLAHSEMAAFYNQSLQSEGVAEPIAFGVRQWLLSIGGTPVESWEALLEIASNLTSGNLGETDQRQLVNDLWKALEYDNPEERIELWIDREPILLAQVDFHRVAESHGVSIPQIAESSTSIADLIIKSTAGVLLRGGLSNHFNYLEDGQLVVNTANPPTLDQGYEVIRRTLEIKETGQKLDNYSAWTLGMLGDQLERFFGDRFDPSMVMEATGKAYNTYITSVNVYKALWGNRRNLSFTHHKEAFYAKLEDPSHKDWILDTSNEMRLSVAQQRKLTSYVRLYGIDPLSEDMPENPEELMERLEVKSVNKNYMFFLRSENKWFSYRGPFEHIPNGADPIINADTRAKLTRDGTPEAMEVWTPVGIAMPYVRGHAAIQEAARSEAIAAETLDAVLDDVAEFMEEVAVTQEALPETPLILIADEFNALANEFPRVLESDATALMMGDNRATTHENTEPPYTIEELEESAAEARITDDLI